MSKEIKKIRDLHARIESLEKENESLKARRGVTMYTYFSGKRGLMTRTDLANMLGLSLSSVNQKMRGATPFTFGEAYLVMKATAAAQRSETIDWEKSIEFFGTRASDLGILDGVTHSAVLKTKIGDKGRV